MRVAYLVGTFPSVSETFITSQIVGLLLRGHEVDICAMERGDVKNVHPEVIRHDLLGRARFAAGATAGRRGFADLLQLAAHCLVRSGPAVLGRCLQARGGRRVLLRGASVFAGRAPYDVIHAHFGQNGLQAVRLREIGAVKGRVVTTFHGTDVTRALRKKGPRVYEELFRLGDLFLPISDLWRRRLVEMGCDEGKIRVHRMGIDTERFRAPQRGGAGGIVRLLSVGRLVPKKGFDRGMRAFASLRSRIPGLRYDIIGDGPLRSELEALVRELGVGGSVNLLGWRTQDEVVVELGKADVLVAPSVTAPDGDQEGIPVVLMEAMASGLPVLTTRHSGIPELVEDGVSGFCVPEGDVDALTGRMEALAASEALRRAMGQAGRERVARDYDIHRLNERLEGLLGEVATTPR